MDYEIRPTNRKELRQCSEFFRILFELSDDEPVNSIELLDRLRDINGFGDVQYEIVEDCNLPGNVPAQCITTDDGYLIQIKESVYNGAYEKKVGGSRMHIMHEIMHVFLDKLGFKPIFSRQLTKETPAYCSLEWAVKAIAGEVMMPYEATQGMSEKELIENFGVSSDAAKKRLRY